MDETDAVVDGALIEWVRAEEAIDVVGSQIRHHFGRRHSPDLDVGVGVDPVLGHVVAEQIVVDRIVEGDGKLEALPGLGIALVLVPD